MGLYSIIKLFAFIMFLSNISLFIILHIKNKEYSIAKNAVSDYAIGSSGKLFNIYLWVGTLGYLLFLFMILNYPGLVLKNILILLLVLIIIFRILLVFFRTDIEGQKLTANGIIHYLLAIGNFSLNYIFIVKFDMRITTVNIYQNYQSLIQMYELALTVILVGVVVTMFRPLRIFFGVVERLYILSIIIWFTAECYM